MNVPQKPVNKWNIRRATNSMSVDVLNNLPLDDIGTTSNNNKATHINIKLKRAFTINNNHNQQNNIAPTKRNKTIQSTVPAATHHKSKSTSGIALKLSADNNSALGTVNQLHDQLQQTIDKNHKLEQQVNELTQANSAITTQYEQAAGTIQHQAVELSTLTSLHQQQSHQLQQLQSTITELRNQILIDSQLRKNIHNQLQTLKGNIRVFIRLRPSNDSAAAIYQIPVNKDNRVLDVYNNTDKLHTFEFDRIFNSDTTQEHIFSDVSELVTSALDGYKVNLMAYGSTGSGKTFTMMGMHSDNVLRGIIPRSVEQLLNEINKLHKLGWSYSIEVSYLEIYNESINDLLRDKRDAELKHEIKLVKVDKHATATQVSNLTTVTLDNVNQIYALLNKANKHRSVASTNCNHQSSRAHSVFTIKLTGTHTLQNIINYGQLTLIDLAGSERLGKTGTDTDAIRLKETQNINKSLSSLGDVIASIATQQSHIPYRNSKLTHLLEPCFAKDSKTLMLIHVSSDNDSISESIQSLRFAQKVSSCIINKANSDNTAANKSRKNSVVKL